MVPLGLSNPCTVGLINVGTAGLSNAELPQHKSNQTHYNKSSSMLSNTLAAFSQ